MKKQLFKLDLKFFDKKGLSSILRFYKFNNGTFFFYCMPILIKHVNEESFEFQNNSKKILAYTLDGKSNSVEGDDQILDEKELLVDIFSLNEIETDQLD